MTERVGASPRPWPSWLIAWLTASALAGLTGRLVPWHLDDRLRCVAAYEATVGPLGGERWVAGAVGSTSVPAGLDPWGRPFRLVQRQVGVGDAGVLRYALSAGPDGVVAQIGVASDDVVVPGPGHPVVQAARGLPSFLVLVVTQLVVCAWAVWTWSPRWPAISVLVATATTVAAGLGATGLLEHGFDLAPPTTLVAGDGTVHVSSAFAGLVGALLVLLARRHHDRERSTGAGDRG